MMANRASLHHQLNGLAAQVVDAAPPSQLPRAGGESAGISAEEGLFQPDFLLSVAFTWEAVFFAES